ncbi:hypothetical protein [Nitritalea halalkaliphila]|uniref:hypothetical protein n=1 Tax=Nitritalea halalkaliphila TaxID=590849 RepID=UPI0012EA6D9A|nr:hypothetical protein [Nitritalea halalkaliphila]
METTALYAIVMAAQTNRQMEHITLLVLVMQEGYALMTLIVLHGLVIDLAG